MKIATIAASATTTVQLNYCPEYVLIKSTATPTKVQVRALGEGVICDLDATGVTLMSSIRDNKPDVTGYFKLRLSDGLLKNKNIEVEVTAGAASTDVFVFSTGELGSNYIVTERMTVLASTSNEFRKFFALGFGAFNTGDQVTVNYTSGLSQVYTSSDEIKALAAETTDDRLLIDNLEQDVSSVVVLPTSNTVYYVQRLKL